MSLLRYMTVDVFTQTRFLGNPLVIIPDSRALAEADMRAIASEFNYSEAAFILPAADPANDASIRIFTPDEEIPFAGHPNVGVAFVLGQVGRLFGRQLHATVRLEQAAGLVVATILREGGTVVGARVLAPQVLQIGRYIDPGAIASCASLDVDDFLLDTHLPIVATVGLPFVLAELNDLETLTKARPSIEHLFLADEVFRSRRIGLFLYVKEHGNHLRVRARMFASRYRMAEDPVTGSAAAALAGLMIARRPEPDLHTHVWVQQGTEIGREGTVEVGVRKVAGSVTEISISGRCVSVMEGIIHLCLFFACSFEAVTASASCL